MSNYYFSRSQYAHFTNENEKTFWNLFESFGKNLFDLGGKMKFKGHPELFPVDSESVCLYPGSIEYISRILSSYFRSKNSDRKSSENQFEIFLKHDLNHKLLMNAWLIHDINIVGDSLGQCATFDESTAVQPPG